MNIYLVRHGKTLLNSLLKNQGWIDSDLTEDGVNELINLFKENDLPVLDSVYCSDLGRTNATFEVIRPYLHFSKDVEIIYSSALRERFLGSFEGENMPKNRQNISEKEGYKDFEEYMSENSFRDLTDATKRYDPLKLAENYAEFSERVDGIIAEIEKQDFENVLIVSHANTVRYIIESLTKKELDFEITNGLVVGIEREKATWKIK